MSHNILFENKHFSHDVTVSSILNFGVLVIAELCNSLILFLLSVKSECINCGTEDFRLTQSECGTENQELIEAEDRAVEGNYTELCRYVVNVSY